MSDFHVVVKLTSGEQVMAVLKDEDDQHVLLDHPMVMRSIMNFEAGKEHLTAAPLCSFTDEHEFVISKQNILFIKRLHYMFVPHYERIVQEHSETNMFVPAQGTAESLRWDDEEEMTPERARKARQMLKQILGEEEEEINWEEKLKNLVPGNDTIN